MGLNLPQLKMRSHSCCFLTALLRYNSPVISVQYKFTPHQKFHFTCSQGHRLNNQLAALHHPQRPKLHHLAQGSGPCGGGICTPTSQARDSGLQSYTASKLQDANWDKEEASRLLPLRDQTGLSPNNFRFCRFYFLNNPKCVTFCLFLVQTPITSPSTGQQLMASSCLWTSAPPPSVFSIQQPKRTLENPRKHSLVQTHFLPPTPTPPPPPRN